MYQSGMNQRNRIEYIYISSLKFGSLIHFIRLIISDCLIFFLFGCQYIAHIFDDVIV